MTVLEKTHLFVVMGTQTRGRMIGLGPMEKEYKKPN